jgi:2-keto-4-pentenoate hydratase/2-oxohepta-3-ene-1,7-dioic acid hydratase in catechol pathway
MKLVSLDANGTPRVGVALDGMVADLSRLAELMHRRAPGQHTPRAPSGMRQFLSEGRQAIDLAGELITFGQQLDPAEALQTGAMTRASECPVLLPVPDPGKIICVGRNYREHADEAGTKLTTVPTVFLRTESSLVPHGAPIIRPRVSEQFDWEGELAVIIGKPARYINPADAWQVIAGYSAFNDGSIRDYQRMSAQWTPGKNFERSGSFGPVLVTADEVPDPAGVALTTRLNGDIVQNASTSEMVFSIPEVISFVSQFTVLEPGDVIATGTPSGVGAFRDPPRYLDQGDVVTIEIGGVTTLENPVEREAAA